MCSKPSIDRLPSARSLAGAQKRMKHFCSIPAKVKALLIKRLIKAIDNAIPLCMGRVFVALDHNRHKYS